MSFHHWMYWGCQCSSARCSRLLLERPTLFGIFSAEIMLHQYARPFPWAETPADGPLAWAKVEQVETCMESASGLLGPVVVEFGPRLRSLGGQRSLLADRVRPDENPVLPRREPA